MIRWIIITFILLGCSGLTPKANASAPCDPLRMPPVKPLKGFDIELVQVIDLSKDLPVIGITAGGQKVYLGGFSGGLLRKKIGHKYKIDLVTDRGPNTEPTANPSADGTVTSEAEPTLYRPYPLPEWGPEQVGIEVNISTGKAKITNRLSLLGMDGKPLSGLSPPRNMDSTPVSRQEIPIDLYGKLLTPDPNGFDSESMAPDPLGRGDWIGGEYAPELALFKDGRMLVKLSPANIFPKEWANRIENRGLEGTATVGKFVVTFLQSPLEGEGLRGRMLAINMHTIKIDMTTGRVDLSAVEASEHFYDFASPETIKIGDAAGLPNGQMLVLERNDVAGPEGKKYLYRVTLGKPGEPVKKEFLADLVQLGIDVEKLEVLIVLDAHNILVFNDNDFGVTGVADFKTGRFQRKDDRPRIFHLRSKLPLWN